MASPVIVEVYTALGGHNEGQSTKQLVDLLAEKGSKNYWIDKYSRIRKVDGYTDLGSTGLSNTMSFVGMYRTTSAELWIATGWASGSNKIFTSSDTGANWSTVVTASGSSSIVFPDAFQYEDTLYITIPEVSLRTYNGSAWGTVGLTQSPTASAAAGSKGLLNGNYRWKLVSVETDRLRHAGSAASTMIQLEDKECDLTWTADADTDVVGYELYRTTGTGGWFYFVDYIDGRTTAAYTDNLSDDQLRGRRVLGEHGDAPPNVHFGEIFKERAWWGRSAANPRRVWISDPGLPESCWQDEQYLDFTDEESQGDALTGLKVIDEALVAFLESSIYTVTGTGRVTNDVADWNVRRSNAQTGTVSGRTALRIPEGAKFRDETGELVQIGTSVVAYLTPFSDIRIFTGDNDAIISTQVKDTLDTIKVANRSVSHAVLDPGRGQAIWFVPIGQTYPDTAIIWNWRFGTWSVEDPAPFYAAALIDEASGGAKIIAGHSTASEVHELWSGNDFDGADIEWNWVSEPLLGVREDGQPAVYAEKRWRWVDITVAEQTQAQIDVEWYGEYDGAGSVPTGKKTITSPLIDLTSSDGNQITSSNGNVIQASSGFSRKKIFLKTASTDYPTGRSMNLGFRESSSVGSVAIETVAIGYQILKGDKRR